MVLLCILLAALVDFIGLIDIKCFVQLSRKLIYLSCMGSVARDLGLLLLLAFLS